MTSKVKLVIFDLDGTLINAYPAVCRSVHFTLSQLGYPLITKEVICKTVGWGERHLLSQFVPSVQIEKALRIYRRHHRQALKTGSRLLPKAKETLKKLREEGYSMAVASNRSLVFSRIVMKHLEIKQYFDYILCADQVSRGKPHPEILELILTRFSLTPDEAVYVGDMGIDIQTGRGAGVETVAVLTGSCTREELRKESPLKILRQIGDMIPWIQKLKKVPGPPSN